MSHTPQAIAFPDVEGLLLAHLSGLLSVPVATQVPNPRPTEWVKIIRTGGPRGGLVVDQAQVTLEYWAATTVAATAGASLVRAHVGALTGRHINGIQIGRVTELSGPSNLPDPTSSSARYTWTVQIPVRGAAL